MHKFLMPSALIYFIKIFEYDLKKKVMKAKCIAREAFHFFYLILIVGLSFICTERVQLSNMQVPLAIMII